VFQRVRHQVSVTYRKIEADIAQFRLYQRISFGVGEKSSPSNEMKLTKGTVKHASYSLPKIPALPKNQSRVSGTP